MSTCSVRDVQLKALECLDELDRICEKHGISYFISWGTVLGAVRHGGFIPWDDDIDVCMMYPDYLKFLQVCTTELDKDNFFVQTPDTDYNTLVPYAKLRMNNTTSMDEKYSHIKMHWGLCIDIFPLRNAPESEKKRKKLVFLSKLLRLTLRRRVISGVNKLLVDVLCTVFTEKRFRKMLYSQIDKLCPENETGTIFDMEGISSNKIFYSTELVKEVAPMEFEGKQYPCPKNTHEYLTYLYGDYMTPPPESARTGHSGVIIDLDKNYTEYQS